MLEMLKELIPMSEPFNQGYITGIAVILGVLVLLLILRLMAAFVFRTKRCSCITIAGEHGDIHIAATAITTSVKALENEFKFINIEKVKLLSRKNNPYMNIDIIFNPNGGGLAPQSSELQAKVISTLFDTFGIEGIKRVDISLKNITVEKSKNNFSAGLQ
jgi:hypothetical protein